VAKEDAKLAKQRAKAEKRAEKEKLRKHRRKAEAVLSRGEVADQLRALASQVESGTLAFGDKEFELPSHLDFELSYQLKKRSRHQFEVEIEWGRDKQASLLATE
jgi:amphi-Trp domain-containing protein